MNRLGNRLENITHKEILDDIVDAVERVVDDVGDCGRHRRG